MISVNTVFLLLVYTAFSRAYVEVITRDICIIGGGSTGTFSAIQLQKAGKSFVVVEKEGILGGHTNTYTDPKTKKTVDYGVLVFENIPIVSDYFNYLAIPWTYGSGGPKRDIKFFNFSTNKIMNNVNAPNSQNRFQEYVAQLAKYPKLSEGFFLSNPVPDQLLLPFGAFAAKYSNMSNAVSSIFTFAQGLGDLLRQPTLYVFKAVGLNLIQKGLVEGFIVTKSSNNMDIYNKAHNMLKDNVLLQSYPIQVNRNTNSVEVIVMTPKGRKLIKAKKLLISIPPKISMLRGFDLNIEETKLFSQFQNTGYYTGVVRNTGLPANIIVENINTKNSYGLPTLPGLYAVMSTAVDGLFDIKYGSPVGIPDADVKEHVLECLLMLQKMGIAKKTEHAPEIVEFRSHTPFALTVPVEAIKAGFYEKLYALQGKRNTFWTGAAFHTQNSGLLWQFTNDLVLPRLIEEL